MVSSTTSHILLLISTDTHYVIDLYASVFQHSTTLTSLSTIIAVELDLVEPA